jgi:hypothetical protein
VSTEVLTRPRAFHRPNLLPRESVGCGIRGVVSRRLNAGLAILEAGEWSRESGYHSLKCIESWRGPQVARVALLF